MKTTFARLALAAALCAGHIAAHAAETPLEVTLENFHEIGSYNFHETEGDTVFFALIGEDTAWAASQTFSVFDGGEQVVLTGEADVGSIWAYTVRSRLTGIAFDSHSPLPGQHAPGGSYGAFRTFQSDFRPNTFAFAYEDYRRSPAEDDYNDMVVMMTVSGIPEPASAALGLAGLSALGAAGLRRARKA